jgi:hypothetical protein
MTRMRRNRPFPPRADRGFDQAASPPARHRPPVAPIRELLEPKCAYAREALENQSRRAKLQKNQSGTDWDAWFRPGPFRLLAVQPIICAEGSLEAYLHRRTPHCYFP